MQSSESSGDNDHVWLLSPEPLVVNQPQLTRVEGASIVMESFRYQYRPTEPEVSMLHSAAMKIVEQRKATISVFNGPPPMIQTFDFIEAERNCVSDWLKAKAQEGLLPHEIAIFVRSGSELDRARAAAELAAIPFKVIDDRVEIVHGKASVATMHLAKGLEFRAVAVMACDDEIIPLQQRIETVADDSDLEEVYNTERQLLYVACTRARDHLLVTSVAPVSEFLNDMQEKIEPR